MENTNKDEEKKAKLHYWYFDKDEDVVYMFGRVSGHERLMDTVIITTSKIVSYEIDEDKKELIARTLNTTYHCPLVYMDFEKQEKADPEHIIFPEYSDIKAKYEGKREEYSIEPGKVLMVVSDFDYYYFHSLYCKPDEDSAKCEYKNQPHIGSYQDSYLVRGLEPMIDIRYFPHYMNMEFYMLETSKMPLFIENIGDSELYCRTKKWQIKLPPHKRVEICKENCEIEKKSLDSGDLYPVAFLL